MIGPLVATVVILLAHPAWWTQLTAALLLAFTVIQIGLIGHDAAHRQVFDRPSTNQLLATLTLNLGLGGSAAWWRDKHNRHHASPNHEDLDPDIDMKFIAFTADQARSRSGLPRFIVRYQARLFFLLVTLVYAVMQGNSVAYLARRFKCVSRLELLCTAVHYPLLYVPLALSMSWLHFVVFAVVFQGAAGVYMACVFAPNHKGMPILATSEAPDFLARQVLTSRNIKDGPLIDFFFGGLSCQIEHHLFPSMPRRHLRAATPYVRQACASNGIEYYEASPLRCYREVVGHLESVSRTMHSGSEPL